MVLRKAYCLACNVEVQHGYGDLGQHTDICIECPCEETYVVPRYREKERQWYLVEIMDLELTVEKQRELLNHKEPNIDFNSKKYNKKISRWKETLKQ